MCTYQWLCNKNTEKKIVFSSTRGWIQSISNILNSKIYHRINSRLADKQEPYYWCLGQNLNKLKSNVWSEVRWLCKLYLNRNTLRCANKCKTSTSGLPRRLTSSFLQSFLITINYKYRYNAQSVIFSFLFIVRI